MKLEELELIKESLAKSISIRFLQKYEKSVLNLIKLNDLRCEAFEKAANTPNIFTIALVDILDKIHRRKYDKYCRMSETHDNLIGCESDLDKVLDILVFNHN